MDPQVQALQLRHGLHLLGSAKNPHGVDHVQWKNPGKSWDILGNQWKNPGKSLEIMGNHWKITGFFFKKIIGKSLEHQWNINKNQWTINGQSITNHGNSWKIMIITS